MMVASGGAYHTVWQSTYNPKWSPTHSALAELGWVRRVKSATLRAAMWPQLNPTLAAMNRAIG